MESNQNFDIFKEIQDALVDVHLERLSIDEERASTAKIIDTFTESYDLICSLVVDNQTPDIDSVAVQLDQIWKQCEAGWSKQAYLYDRKKVNEEKGAKLLKNIKDIGEIL